MLEKIIAFSVRNKLIVFLGVFCLIIYGTYQLKKLPIDAVPDITNNQVQVISIAPALGANDIERLVTFPIELANNNISGLEEIRSFSRFGLSLVTIVFKDDIDIYWARQQVAERIQQVQAELPEGVSSVSLGPVTTGLGEIYQYSLRAKKGFESKYNAQELRTIQDWIVRRQLLGVKGVADVSSFGGKLKEYEIAIDPSQLNSFNLTINDVFTALKNNNQNTGGAYIEKGPTVLYIRSEGLTKHIADLKNILIKQTKSGTPIFIKDIATVSIGNAIRYGAMCYNNEGEVAGAVVMMLKGENSSDVIKNIKERIEQIKKTLPEGIILEPFLDRTKMVNNAIRTVNTNLLEGALIVLFVLILFLGNLRAGALIASVIPLAMLFAIILMNQFGVIGNLMSLGALDFGLIVDGSVFIVEAVLHYIYSKNSISKGEGEFIQDSDTSVINASSKIARSVVFGQLIILVVYLPTFALSGIEGKMFIPMAQTVSFALLGAFILSLTYVPMMSALLFKNQKEHKVNFSDKMMFFFERIIITSLHWVIIRPRKIVLVAIALFAFSVFLLMGIGGEFIPALEEGDFAVETRVLTGSNINTTINATQMAAGILKEKFPEVEQVVTKIGSGEIPTDPMPMEAADMMIILKPKSEWTSANSFDELAEKMNRAVSAVPGITTSFQFPVQMRFNELMTGAKQDVVCKIFGENLDTLALYSKKIGSLVTTLQGSQNLYLEPITGMPQLVIRYNRAKLAQFGISVNDVNTVLNMGLAGQSAGFIYDGEKRFDVVVRIAGTHKKSIDDVKNILIQSALGKQIPLSEVADIEISDGPNQIQREDAKRRIIVGFNVRNRDVESVVNELKNKIEGQIKFPAGYFIVYGGAFENLNSAKSRLAIAVPLALLLIFILLYFSFNSVTLGLLIYSAIPLSAMGGIFALVLRGMPFSISAGVGFIALFGVAVLNGIVLISEFKRLQEEGISDLKQILVQGIQRKLRPVLMTAFVASLGFLPMALSNGSGAEVQRPLATVVIGGLLIATLLTIFVLPSLYLMVMTKSIKKFKLFKFSSLLLIAIIPLCSSVSVKAQESLNFSQSIDSALKYNLRMKAGKLDLNAKEKLIQSAWDIDKTDFNAEWGQMNSIYKDNKLSVSQNFKWPGVYKAQKNIMNVQWQNASIEFEIRKADFIKELCLVYADLIYFKQCFAILNKADSVYNLVETASQNRLIHGETNSSEVNLISIQKAQLMSKKVDMESDFNQHLSIYNFLLGTPKIYFPDWSEKLIPAKILLDSVEIQHPIVLFNKSLEEISKSQLKFQKTQWLPDLSIGYNNMTIQGTGSDDINYTLSKRFQSVGAGISIPLFYNSNNVKIKALKINDDVVRLKAKMAVEEFKIKQKNIVYKYNKLKQLNALYENKVLVNAEDLLQNATLNYTSGNINVMEWYMFFNQYLEAYTSYQSNLNNLNKCIVELNFYTSK